MKRKRDIHKTNTSLRINTIIKRNFTSDSSAPRISADALKLNKHLSESVRPISLLQGLQREISSSIASAEAENQIQVLTLLRGLEDDLKIAIDAYERGESDFVACQMFHLGRKVEIINAMPFMKVAISTASRKHKSGSATAEKYAYFLELAKDLVDQENALEWKKRGFKERIAGKLCQHLINHSDERDKAGLKNDIPSMEACRRKVQQAIDELSLNTTG